MAETVLTKKGMAIKAKAAQRTATKASKSAVVASGYGSGYVSGAGPTAWTAPSQPIKASALKLVPKGQVSPTPAWSLVGSYQPTPTKKDVLIEQQKVLVPASAQTPPQSEDIGGEGVLGGVGTAVGGWISGLAESLGGAGGVDENGILTQKNLLFGGAAIAAIVGIAYMSRRKK